MADLLLVRAKNGTGHGITWEFVDKGLRGCSIVLDQPPSMTISDGDVWRVELIDEIKEKGTRRKKAIVRLVTLVQKLQSWERIHKLPNFYIEHDTLRAILAWLHEGTDLILIGSKGTGKTTLSFALAKALGWQQPYKVDVYTIKRTSDLFGSDAAIDGSTVFRRSGLLDYIERAHIALDNDLDDQFLVVLDEVNRVHAKSNESMHGLFDDTRQVSITTTEGSKTIKLPRNIHFVGTMNLGSQYVGTHELDEALKDRFAPIKLSQMPEDFEVKRLKEEVQILESQALAIVQVARALRQAADNGQIGFSPSYRSCRNAARLVKHDTDLRMAVIKSFLGWYEGDLNADKEPADPNSELAKAYASLRMRGVASNNVSSRASDATGFLKL